MSCHFQLDDEFLSKPIFFVSAGLDSVEAIRDQQVSDAVNTADALIMELNK